MKSFTGMIGWLLLVVALAAPSLLFYNWWTGNKKNETAVQSVSTATVFPGGQDKSAAPTVVQPSIAVKMPVLQPAPITPVSAAAPVTGIDPQRVYQSTAADQRGKTPPAHVSYFSPKSDRDPTMTPGDYQKIQEEGRQRLKDERMKQQALLKQRKDAGGENRIKMQGIVGNSVIINGEMHSVGDTVTGVKIIKIGPNYIIGEYKGKRFKKNL